MKKRAIIFIDANNWYHNLKKIYIKPGDIDIKKVSELISSNFKLDIKDIRWYVSTPSIRDGELMYYRHMSFLSSLQKHGITVITRKLQQTSSKEAIEKKKELINSLELCKICRPVVEENFIQLADLKKKEKGIDVWIAIDMLNKSVIEDDCDCCVLISGDADFIPALELIKSKEKDVLSVFVPAGYSFEIRKKFRYFFLGKNKLISCFKEYKEIKEERID